MQLTIFHKMHIIIAGKQLLSHFAKEVISSFRINGHLHKEHAAVFSGIDKNFTLTSANEGNLSCPGCRMGEMPMLLVKQHYKPVKIDRELWTNP